MKTMKAMKTKNSTKTKSMNAMKAMKTKNTKKKPAQGPSALFPPFIPFVFDSSVERDALLNDYPDCPIDERDALLNRVAHALLKWRTRPKWFRDGAHAPGLEHETSLVGWMMESGIRLSLNEPPIYHSS